MITIHIIKKKIADGTISKLKQDLIAAKLLHYDFDEISFFDIESLDTSAEILIFEIPKRSMSKLNEIMWLILALEGQKTIYLVIHDGVLPKC